MPTGNIQNQRDGTIITLSIQYRIRLVEDVVSTWNIRVQNHQCWCRYSDVQKCRWYQCKIHVVRRNQFIWYIIYVNSTYACLLGTVLISNGIPASTPSIYSQPEWGQVQKKAQICLNNNAWWRHLQPYPPHIFNLLILVDNETVPSLLYVVLCNCKTGYGYIQNMHAKTQWYLMLCVTLTGIGRGHGQNKR